MFLYIALYFNYMTGEYFAHALLLLMYFKLCRTSSVFLTIRKFGQN